MSERKKNKLKCGWVLCPSNSFPGNFYYFNVKNGEAVWSRNQSYNKLRRRERSSHKRANKSRGYPDQNTLPEDKSHGYPEPTTLPDPLSFFPKSLIKEPILKLEPKLPTPIIPNVAQATFPEYVPNTKPALPNIVTTIKNTENPFLRFDGRHKIVKPFGKFEISTPKNLFLECKSESLSFFPKSLNKEPVLKLELKLPTPIIPDVFKSNEKPIISLCSKVASTVSSIEVPKIVNKVHILENIDCTGLGLYLMAMRKPVAAKDTAVKRPFKLDNSVPVQDALHTSSAALALSVAQHCATERRSAVDCIIRPKNRKLDNLQQSDSRTFHLDDDTQTTLGRHTVADFSPCIPYENDPKYYNEITSPLPPIFNQPA